MLLPLLPINRDAFNIFGGGHPMLTSTNPGTLLTPRDWRSRSETADHRADHRSQAAGNVGKQPPSHHRRRSKSMSWDSHSAATGMVCHWRERGCKQSSVTGLNLIYVLFNNNKHPEQYKLTV
jgi:hypothetical protein